MNTLEEHYLSDEQVADIVQDISDKIKFPLMGAGGGFAPIGTESYFDGTSAPQGWLLCNGQTLNITDYPELAAYFASHHGRSNYYGGNGTTTFAVPTRKGMPEADDESCTGVFTLSHDYGNGYKEYFAPEKIVGIYDDGKPVYKKSIKLTGALPSAAGEWVTYSDVGASVENVVKISGIANQTGDNASGVPLPCPLKDNANAALPALYKNTANSNVRNKLYLGYGKNCSWISSMIIHVYYTKTTDSAVAAGHSADGNGVFCIKATVAGDPNGHVYSTEEHVVGQWIDGKVLYEKTVTGTTASTAGTWKTFANLGTNCSIIKAEGYVINSQSLRYPIDYIDYEGNGMDYCLNYDGTEGVIKSGSFSHRPLSAFFCNASIVATLQYTKS